MVSPSFLNTGFAFTTIPAATDVQNIMDAVNTMLTATLGSAATGVYPSGERWSAAGFVFTAPSDNGGRFMKVTLARTAQGRMEFKFEDPAGVIQDGEIDINIAGTLVNIYGGPGHLVIEANNAGTWEIAAAIMTDPTPEPLAASLQYVFGRVFRTTAGALIGNATQATWWLFRYTGGTTTAGVFANSAAVPKSVFQDNLNTKIKTVAGSDVVAPIYMGNDTLAGGGSLINCGKLYQMCAVDGNNGQGSIMSIPVDTGITAQFQVLHLGPTGCTQVAMRKG